MDVFLEMLAKNLTITLLIIIPIGLLLIGITIIYTIAFFQGRSISFYPPHIGELPSSPKKSASKNTDSLQKEISLPQGKIGITAFYNMEDQLMQHKRNEDTKYIVN